MVEYFFVVVVGSIKPVRDTALKSLTFQTYRFLSLSLSLSLSLTLINYCLRAKIRSNQPWRWLQSWAQNSDIISVQKTCRCCFFFLESCLEVRTQRHATFNRHKKRCAKPAGGIKMSMLTRLDCDLIWVGTTHISSSGGMLQLKRLTCVSSDTIWDHQCDSKLIGINSDSLGILNWVYCVVTLLFCFLNLWLTTAADIKRVVNWTFWILSLLLFFSYTKQLPTFTLPSERKNVNGNERKGNMSCHAFNTTKSVTWDSVTQLSFNHMSFITIKPRHY